MRHNLVTGSQNRPAGQLSGEVVHSHCPNDVIAPVLAEVVIDDGASGMGGGNAPEGAAGETGEVGRVDARVLHVLGVDDQRAGARIAASAHHGRSAVGHRHLRSQRGQGGGPTNHAVGVLGAAAIEAERLGVAARVAELVRAVVAYDVAAQVVRRGAASGPHHARGPHVDAARVELGQGERQRDQEVAVAANQASVTRHVDAHARVRVRPGVDALLGLRHLVRAVDRGGDDVPVELDAPAVRVARAVHEELELVGGRVPIGVEIEPPAVGIAQWLADAAGARAAARADGLVGAYPEIDEVVVQGRLDGRVVRGPDGVNHCRVGIAGEIRGRGPVAGHVPPARGPGREQGTECTS